jgi:peptide chain release factor 1
MRAMASEESTALNSTLQTLVESTFPSLLLPPSPTAQLSALLELKSGVGGSESSLFAGDLLRMYQRLAVQRGWKAEIAAKNDTDDGGVKDVIMEIKGVGAYDALRWESGVHRVQRVPATESKGRVHTSAVAVLVRTKPEFQSNSLG